MIAENIPGFTAEASLYATEERYSFAYDPVTDITRVLPQRYCYPVGRGMYMCCDCDFDGCRCEGAGLGHILQ